MVWAYVKSHLYETNWLMRSFCLFVSRRHPSFRSSSRVVSYIPLCSEHFDWVWCLCLQIHHDRLVLPQPGRRCRTVENEGSERSIGSCPKQNHLSAGINRPSCCSASWRALPLALTHARRHNHTATTHTPPTPPPPFASHMQSPICVYFSRASFRLACLIHTPCSWHTLSSRSRGGI